MVGHTCEVRTKPLAMILEQHLPPGQAIDFMTVDVEGMDEEVIRSNNWERYRPRFLLAESRQTKTVDEALNTSLHEFIKSQSYTLIAKCMNTLVYGENFKKQSSH